MSITVAQWTFFLSLCASKNLLFALDFSTFHGGIAPSFFHSLSTAAFGVRNLHGLWQRKKLLQQIVMCHRTNAFSCNAIFMNFGQQRFCSLYNHTLF